MALFGSIFKSRSEKKEEHKAPSAPVAAPASAKLASTSFPSRAPAGKTAPGAPQKPMQLDEIVAALQQIESIMSEPAEATPAKQSARTSDHLESVSLSLSELVQLVPSSFNDMQVSPGDKVDVVIEDLFSQMSKGKIETTLGHLLSGVPKQYLVNPADLKSEVNVSLPLPLVVAAVDPNDFRKRTANVRRDQFASELPNLFATVMTAPEKPSAAPASPVVEKPLAAPAVPVAPALNLKLSDLRAVLPSAFKSASVPPDARADVPIDDVFGQLARGRVEVPVNQLLSGVPKQYLSAGTTLDAEVLVVLPLSIVVSAVPADELKKRTSLQSSKPIGHNLPDLFQRADDKEAPPAAKPAVPAVPRIAPEATKKVEPKASPVPEARPAPQAKAVPKPELKIETKAEPKPAAKVEPPPRPKLELKPTEKVEPKIGLKPAAPVPTAAPVIPVPKAAPKTAALAAPRIPTIPVAKPAPKAEPVVPFTGPAPRKFMPMDLVASASMAPPSSEKQIEPKIERQKPPVPAAPAPVSVSDIPVLLLRGLDLNQASAEELMRVVDGIGEAMAQRIVDDRTENGPFFGLYDLGRVSGIGSKIYEKITGQPWLEEKYGQLFLVDELLGRWTGKHPDLKDVAGKFKEIAGFEGCMILHRDGDLLATSWQVESPERLQAMAPQILKKVKHYMRHIAQGETYSVTVFLEGVSFTFVESEDICFVAVQNPKGLSRRHIQIVNGLGVALGRRFSGYRGA